MRHAKKRTFSRTYSLLVVLMLMLARASASLAAVPQASSEAQAPNAMEPASDSIVPRLIQFSGVVKDAEGKPATGSLELTFFSLPVSRGRKTAMGGDSDRAARLSGTLHHLAGRQLIRRSATGRFHQWDGAVVGGSARAAECW